MSAASVFETASSQEQERDLGRFHPIVPRHVDELGINQNTIVNLMLKMTLLEGETSLSMVADRLKVHQVVADEVFQHLRREQFVEVKGMMGNDYVLTLTQTGRTIAQDRYHVSQYVGPGPVPFDEYNHAVRSQTSRHHVNRDKLQEVFSDLCLSDSLLDELGPAIMSNAQIFLYGSTGNGKTSIAERLVRIFKDDVYIPYAVEVDGQIINVHDSVVHRELEAEPDTDPR